MGRWPGCGGISVGCGDDGIVVRDAVETAWVRHRSGGMSVIGFKSYDHRREAFEQSSSHERWLAYCRR